jgi:hypothetical protein
MEAFDDSCLRILINVVFVAGKYLFAKDEYIFRIEFGMLQSFYTGSMNIFGNND